MGIKITAYHYNTLCDTYNCAGMARVSLSMDDTPGSLKHNICNDCLEGIVAAAPLHMVLAREDVQQEMQRDVSAPVETDTEDKLDIPVGYAIPEFYADALGQAETAPIKSYNWQDLKKLARDLKIENCNSMKRETLEAEILKRL